MPSGKARRAGRADSKRERRNALDRWWCGLSPVRRDLLVAAFMGLLTVIYFAPFIFSDKMLFGTDIIPMGYAARKMYAEFVRETLSLPHWNPYILGGLPFVEALHGDIFYPASLLYLFMPVHRAIGMKLVLHIFVAGIAMYVYLRGLSIRRGVAAVGGVGYMFAPYLVSLIFAGHDAKMYVTALFPLLLYALERAVRRGDLLSVSLGGAVVGLMILSSHVQMAYFALWGGAIYFLVLLVRQSRSGGGTKPALRAILLVALAVTLGLGIGLAQLLPTYLYTREFSPRAGGVDYEFASSWSLHPEEVLSLVIPQFGGYQETYWGRNRFKLNCESPGLLVMFFALAALLWHRRRPVWTALGIGLFALAYGLGAHTPIHHLFFALAPGVKMFRAPSIIMFIFSWAMATLAAVGLARFWGDGGEPGGSKGGRRLLTIVGIWWGVFALAVVLRERLFTVWTSLFYQGITPEARATMLAHVPDFLTEFALGGVVLLAAALLLSRADYLPLFRILGRGGVAAALSGLIVLSSWWVGRDFVKPVRLSDYIAEDAMVRHLEDDTDLFRVLPLTGRGSFDQNYLPIFGVQTANGFHDNRMASYDHFMNRILAGPGQLNFRVLDLLNIKYLVIPGPVGNHPVLTDVMGSRWGELVLNRGHLPRAFLVHRYRVLGEEEAIQELTDGDMNLGEEIVLAEEPESTLSDPPAQGPREEVEVIAYTMREVRLRARAASAALLYLGDNFFPSWKAFVDGKEVPVYRANVSFRALPVPPGEHTVEFRYRSPVLGASIAVSGLSGLLVLAGLLGAALRGRPGWRSRGGAGGAKTG